MPVGNWKVDLILMIIGLKPVEPKYVSVTKNKVESTIFQMEFGKFEKYF